MRVFTLCAFLFAIPAEQTRNVPTATARLSGVVIEEGSNPARGIRRAIVTVTGTSIATSLQVVTDDDGRFVVLNLPAGRFSLTAEKPAYIKSFYGSPRIGRPPGMPVALADGQSMAAITIPLIRGAAIGGTVREATGVPVAGAQIMVHLVTTANGMRKLVAPLAGTRLATTDDRGEYRLWGLPPGEYVISAGGGGAQGSGSARVMSAEDIAAAEREVSGAAAAAPAAQRMAAPTPPLPTSRMPSYYGGVVDPAQALGIVVAAGDERLGIDIVSVIGRVAPVRGNAIGPDGRPVTNMSVGLAHVSSGSISYSPGAIRPNAAGEFTVPGLTPGRWLLFGRGAEPNTPSDGRFPWWTQQEFVVGDQELTGVVLQFAPGSIVNGKLVFDGATARPDLSKLRVSLAYLPPVDGMSAFVQPVTPQADGSFTVEAVPPGRYRVSVSAAGAWALRSATSDGRDTLDVPLEIATGQTATLTLSMTDRLTEISGVLLDQLGRPAPEYSVVVFSADRAMWTVSPRRSSGIVKLGSDGRYRITGLPAGDYLLSVITDLEPSQLNDIAILEELARAGVPISLADGDKKVQDLKIGG